MAADSPPSLALKAATGLLRADAPLAAAIVLAELARGSPDDPDVWAVLGTAVARSAGVIEVAPFVRWGTRCFKRSLFLAPTGAFADTAAQWLADLRTQPTYQELPHMEAADLDALLAYLDIHPEIVVEAIDKVGTEDQMFQVMAIGDLGAPRFLPVAAAAVSGRWGGGPARAALKRAGPYLGAPALRAALVTLRSSPLGEACDPYLASVEARPVPMAPPTIERRRGPASAKEVAAPATRPWWRRW